MIHQTTLPDSIDVITRTFGRMEAKAIDESDFGELSLRQISCLDTIQRLDEPTPTDLAAALGITKPSVSALVDRLVKAGYIFRERSHLDGRSFHLHLTQKGLDTMGQHQRVHETIARHLLAGLDEDEQCLLVSLLAKVADHLSE